ncbi:hypothetical protein BTN50_0861 [Candidatus Enterovibrio altilux]|uniref:Uncharacterized protein n=1 Tax=Candidatus Enterovibrio altilux TaxID=1927128 RepID=A0A291B8N7_9GAMM|nr:hypothetical protein BTN50_0861 [Candidatus Enterovibrio luxaltus]
MFANLLNGHCYALTIHAVASKPKRLTSVQGEEQMNHPTLDY